MKNAPAHGPRRWWRRLSPTAFRRLWIAVAGVALAVSVLSARYDLELAVRLPGNHNTGATFAASSLTLWWYRDSSWASARTNPGVVGWRLNKRWVSDMNLAWRPYHIASRRFPQPSDHHGILVPLWPLFAGAIIMAGYSHGLIVGARRAAIGRCTWCGYDLRALPPGSICPECGCADSGKVAQRHGPDVEPSAAPVL